CFIIYAFLRINAIGLYTPPMQYAPIAKVPFIERLITIPSIILFYLVSFIFPNKLAVSYEWVYTKFDYHFFLPLVIDGIVVSVFIFLRRILFKKYSRIYFKSYVFFILWFLLGICINLQLLPLDG